MQWCRVRSQLRWMSRRWLSSGEFSLSCHREMDMTTGFLPDSTHPPPSHYSLSWYWVGSIWYQQSPVCISQGTPSCQASLRKTPATLCHSQVTWLNSPTDCGNARGRHSVNASLFDRSCVDACRWFNYLNLCKHEVKLELVCPLYQWIWKCVQDHTAEGYAYPRVSHLGSALNTVYLKSAQTVPRQRLYHGLAWSLVPGLAWAKEEKGLLNSPHNYLLFLSLSRWQLHEGVKRMEVAKTFPNNFS